MNFQRKNAAALPEFQLAPMIDVVFLLLCFFITTAVFSQWEYEVDVKLPTAATGRLPERLPGDVIVNIARDGSLSVNQTALSRDDLSARLTRLAQLFPGQSVVIRADRETAYENVMAVIDLCRRADIWNLLFATGEEEK
ncbi:MAG: biopolymer transporter ExbD [Kiritimatiellaeota bacterium]|nr:biopolymer transporter ExbD [Kiritimatiellota bacterium]